MRILDQLREKYGHIDYKADYLKRRSEVKTKKQDYQDYLLSEQWRQLKVTILHKRGYQCEWCGNSKNLQLHHITYERFKNEREDDVEILCGKCHKKAHRK